MKYHNDTYFKGCNSILTLEVRSSPIVALAGIETINETSVELLGVVCIPFWGENNHSERFPFEVIMINLGSFNEGMVIFLVALPSLGTTENSSDSFVKLNPAVLSDTSTWASNKCVL